MENVGYMWSGMGTIRISVGPETASVVWKSADTYYNC